MQHLNSVVTADQISPLLLSVSLCVHSNLIHFHCVRFHVTAAVIILLLIAQAACGPVKTTAQALNNTIELMQKEIRTALGALVSFLLLN